MFIQNQKRKEGIFLYTRSYPRQENKKNSSPPEQTFNTPPPHKILNESEIPAGYSGTAVLRENEAVNTAKAEITGNETSSAYDSPQRTQIHAKKFKIATKITPNLWRGSEDKSAASAYEKPDRKLYDGFSEDTLPDGCQNDTVKQNEAVFEDNSTCDSPCRNTEKDDCKKDCDESKYNESKYDERRKRRPRRRFLLHSPAEKHLLKRTPAVDFKDRCFSLEDLLLGGLILLLLNESADDDVILIFGFLLFSSL